MLNKSPPTQATIIFQQPEGPRSTTPGVVFNMQVSMPHLCHMGIPWVFGDTSKSGMSHLCHMAIPWVFVDTSMPGMPHLCHMGIPWVFVDTSKSGMPHLCHMAIPWVFGDTSRSGMPHRVTFRICHHFLFCAAFLYYFQL